MPGSFGENFPYSNFHDMNMDWIIKIAKDFLDQYSTIQETIQTGLTDLDNKATELEELLQAWYDTHSQDIANQLASALESLNAWYTQHQNYLDQTLQNNITAFNTHAEQKAAQTIASIPDDYTQLSQDVVTIKESLIEMGYSDVFDASTLANGYVTNGTVVPDSATYPYRHTDYIPVSYGDIIHFASSNGMELCAFEGYTEDKTFVKDFIKTEAGHGPGSLAIDRRNIKYLRYNVMPVYVTEEADQYLIIQHGFDYLWTNDIININSADLFTRNNIAGYIIDQAGTQKTSQYVTSWAVTDYIEIPSKCFLYWAVGQRRYGAQIPAVYVYDENKNPLFGLYSPEQDGPGSYLLDNPLAKYIKYNVYPNASFNYNNQYLRYEVPFNIQNTINIEKLLSSNHERITVSHDGTGTYNNFAEALTYAYQKGNVDIFVKAGTYDIIAELNITSDEDCPGYGEGNNTAWGLKIGKNVRVFGEHNTKLVANYTGSSTNFTNKFSMLNVTGNYELHNIDFECQNIRYCIHEDVPTFGPSYAEGMQGYTSLIENCNMVNRGGGYSSPACMGCGDTDNSLTIVEGGSYYSLQYSYPISMHNHAGAAGGEIIVKDVYFKNGTLRLAGFNTTATGQITNATVTGNSMEDDVFIDLSPAYITLVKWNNNIRN